MDVISDWNSYDHYNGYDYFNCNDCGLFFNIFKGILFLVLYLSIHTKE